MYVRKPKPPQRKREQHDISPEAEAASRRPADDTREAESERRDGEQHDGEAGEFADQVGAGRQRVRGEQLPSAVLFFAREGKRPQHQRHERQQIEDQIQHRARHAGVPLHIPLPIDQQQGDHEQREQGQE
jgi:hypothetical protein